MNPTKICSRCKIKKPMADYWDNQSACKNCRIEQTREYRKNNPVKRICKLCGGIYTKCKRTRLGYCSDKCFQSITHKTCSKCATEKPINEFPKIGKICKACKKDYNYELFKRSAKKKTCKACKKKYLLSKTRGSYCSDKCRQNSLNTVCRYCGVKFICNEKYKFTVCHKCYKLACLYPKPKPRECWNCGKECRTNKNFYCSRECVNDYLNNPNVNVKEQFKEAIYQSIWPNDINPQEFQVLNILAILGVFVTSQQLSKVIGLAKGYTAEILASLSKKGLVSDYVKKGVLKYYALSPKSLSLLEGKANEETAVTKTKS